MEHPHFLFVFLYCMLYYLTDTYEKIPLSQREKNWKPKGTERFVLCIFNSKYRSVKPI